MSSPSQRGGLAAAARTLSRLGMVTAFGHVSARSDSSMLITPAVDLADVTEADLVEVALSSSTLPVGAPAEAWAHLALYRSRPDAQSVARAQPAAAFTASVATSDIPPLYGQAAWLGASVHVHDSAHLLRTAERAAAAAASMSVGEALLLRGNGALTLGASPGVAVTRMWLLDRLCAAWLLAKAAGDITALTAEEIASWRGVGEELLPRLWQHLSRAGQSPNHQWETA